MTSAPAEPSGLAPLPIEQPPRASPAPGPDADHGTRDHAATLSPAPAATDGRALAEAAGSSGGEASLALARRGFAALLLSHALIDVFPVFFTSLMLILRERLSLSEWQVAAVFMVSPIFSGVGQPFFAWLTDKHDSRLAGPGGMALGAVCIGSIGFAQNFWQLVILQMIGVIGTGMFHPVGTAVAGQAGTQLLNSRRARTNGRAMAIGIFIASGMVGQSLGPVIATRVTDHFGMPALAWLIAPALLVAVLLHVSIRRLPHRSGGHRGRAAVVPADEVRLRWWIVCVLMVQNCLRFTTNLAMFVMFNVWADAAVRTSAAALRVADEASRAAQAAGASAEEAGKAASHAIATQGAHLAANLSSALTIGIGISVLSAGRFFQPGRERGPLLWLSMVGAAAIALMGPAGESIAARGAFGFAAMWPLYLCALLGPVGFFATFPLATSLAQRLQPGHTSLVSSMMMGVGWGVSVLAPPLAMLFFGGVSISAAALLPLERISVGYYGFASLLVVAGLLSLLLPRWLLGKVASER
jgi:FSR family fosmidomycin resistance protein-like MFS transporter